MPKASTRSRIVVIEFPSCQAASKFRQPGSAVEVVIIEGYDGPCPQ